MQPPKIVTEVIMLVGVMFLVFYIFPLMGPRVDDAEFGIEHPQTAMPNK